MFKNIKSVEFYNILPYILQLTPQNIGTQVICQSINIKESEAIINLRDRRNQAFKYKKTSLK